MEKYNKSRLQKLAGLLNENQIIYKHSFGSESEGKIEKTEEGLFQCYETSLFGGIWQKVGDPFSNLEEAKKFLTSLT